MVVIMVFFMLREQGMINQQVTIINKLGLHARASSKLVQLAKGFESEIFVEKNGKRANAKSIMSLMMLAAAKGSVLTITANGKDEVHALSEVLELINNRFGEAQ